MWSLSLVMSECFLSGRSQGHVSNFYIVDLENFATASRRYTGDIHNSTVVGLFMTPETMGADSVASWLSAHCLSRIASDWISNFVPSIWSGLVVKVVSALLRGSWQDFNWHDASRGPSAIAELVSIWIAFYPRDPIGLLATVGVLSSTLASWSHWYTLTAYHIFVYVLLG